MKVVIAGDTPFAEEIAGWCVTAGHDTVVYLVADFLSAAAGGGAALTPVDDADVLIEVQNDSPETKRDLLLQLTAAAPPDTLLLTSALATNTTLAASWVPHPERVVGFGVVPPLSASGTVELAAGLNTDEAALHRAIHFWEEMGHATAVVGDSAGLVRARVVCCLINEAAAALHERIASAEDIDRAMQLGTNYPHGPLAWGDHLGLDTVLGIMNGLYAEWREDRYRPSPLLRNLVTAGRLGKKSGRGFYAYDLEAGITPPPAV